MTRLQSTLLKRGAMKYRLWLTILLVLMVGLAACTAEDQSEAPAEPDGPALVMFYTDN
jgi:hypothetical protein